MKLNNKLSILKKNDFWKKLFKNVLTVLAGNFGSGIINFIITLIMLKSLGNTNYGIFLVALQYMNLIDGIVNFQSWAGVIKYGSEAIVEKRDDKLAAIFKSGFIIDILTALLGAVIAMVILPVIVYFMKWNKELVALAAIFSIEILFHIEGTSIGVLRLFDKFNLTAIQSIITALIKLFLIGIYVLFGGKSLAVMTVLYMITDVIKHILLVFMAIKVLNDRMGIKKVFKIPINVVDKSFLKYTIWNNFGYTVDVPTKYFDVFIISLISVDLVAIYKIFTQVMQIIQMVITPISMVSLPQFSLLMAEGKGRSAYKKVGQIKKLILILGSVLLLGSVLVGKFVLGFVFGEEYGNNIFLFNVLLILNIYCLSNVAVVPCFASLGKAKQGFLITVFTNIVYCILAYITVGYIGIYAVIVAKAISSILSFNIKKIYIREYVQENDDEKN